jgi:hypothetical protein
LKVFCDELLQNRINDFGLVGVQVLAGCRQHYENRDVA